MPYAALQGGAEEDGTLSGGLGLNFGLGRLGQSASPIGSEKSTSRGPATQSIMPAPRSMPVMPQSMMPQSMPVMPNSVPGSLLKTNFHFFMFIDAKS